MSRAQSDPYSSLVGQVFDSRPRIAVDDDSRWMRRKEEDKFRRAVLCSGTHVCLYGPSGSGKTSLAKTILSKLHRKGFRFIYTRINQNSTWETLKFQIIGDKQTESRTAQPFGVKIALKNLIPFLEIDGEIGGGALTLASSKDAIAKVVDITTIGRLLIDLNLILAIDDINFASDDLLRTIGDLSKEITDTSHQANTKIIFIGSDDIYSRILQQNDSLKERIEEVSLGSIVGDDGEPSTMRRDIVWKFIADGLVQLGLSDPRRDKNITNIQLKECQQWLELAADGLPKSIVRLGQKIAFHGVGRNRISFSDIKTAAIEMTRSNFRHYRSRYRTLVYALKKHELLQDVCLWMFTRGSSGIFNLEDIAEDHHELASYDSFEKAIKRLEDMNFLVITGADQTTFFAREPLLAHTIGAALTSPEQCGVDPTYFKGDPAVKQLLIRFTGKKDPQHRTCV